MRAALLAFLFLGLGVGVSACGPAANKAVTQGPCADDGPRLKLTGLCQGRSDNYLDPEAISTSPAPEDCMWSMNEAAFPGDDTALLYQALSCNGRITELEVRGGARSASIGHVTSGFFDSIPSGLETGRMFPIAEGTDAKAYVLSMAKETTEDKKEAAACEIRELTAEQGPRGAFVIDVSQAYRKANNIVTPVDEPAGEIFCGPYGYISDGQRFWRITGGYAFLFDFGQDTPDYDAGSLVVMKKNGDGGWAVVP